HAALERRPGEAMAHRRGNQIGWEGVVGQLLERDRHGGHGGGRPCALRRERLWRPCTHERGQHNEWYRDANESNLPSPPPRLRSARRGAHLFSSGVRIAPCFARSKSSLGSRPVAARYHAGWCVQAQRRETTPRVIEWKVPGCPKVPS